MMTCTLNMRSGALAGVAILLTAAGASADWWHAETEHELYGWADQHDVPDIGPVACAPTSVINSFWYLQTKYPEIYDHKLIWDRDNDGDVDYWDQIWAAEDLGKNWMLTTPEGGTTDENLIWGKYNYMEHYAQGTTSYAGMHGLTWDPQYPWPEWLTSGHPTWEFLYEQLDEEEDVELWIGVPGTMAHCVTLTSLHWNDETDDGWIDFIDPDDGGLHVADVHLFGEVLQAKYNCQWVDISIALSESPQIPGPASLALLALAGTLRSRRRRR